MYIFLISTTIAWLFIGQNIHNGLSVIASWKVNLLSRLIPLLIRSFNRFIDSNPGNLWLNLLGFAISMPPELRGITATRNLIQKIPTSSPSSQNWVAWQIAPCISIKGNKRWYGNSNRILLVYWSAPHWPPKMICPVFSACSSVYALPALSTKPGGAR